MGAKLIGQRIEWLVVGTMVTRSTRSSHSTVPMSVFLGSLEKTLAFMVFATLHHHGRCHRPKKKERSSNYIVPIHNTVGCECIVTVIVKPTTVYLLKKFMVRHLVRIRLKDILNTNVDLKGNLLVRIYFLVLESITSVTLQLLESKWYSTVQTSL